MASFDEYKKKMNSKYGVKTDEKEGKKEEEKKPSSPSSGSSTKFQDYRSKMESKYNTVSDVDENYINTFIQDADKFMNSAQSSYQGMNWGNASSIYETSQKTIEDLRKRSSVIEQYLDRNKAAIDLEQYNSFKNYLKEFGKFASSSAYSFYNQSKFYSQFETQKSYDDYVAYQRDYEEKKNFDLDAGQKEIRDLENLLKEYQLLVKWSVDGEGARRAEEIRNQYGGAKGIKDLISQRTAYLNQAKRIQNGITLSGAAGNADFKDYSGYVSTKDDGVWSRMTSDYGLGYEDLTYEYINNQNGLRDEIKQKHRTYDRNDDESVYESKGYDYLRDDEIAIYNYYYAKEGREKAEEYLDSIQEVLNQRKATSMYGNMEGKTALELAFQAVAGVENWRSGMKNIFNNEDDYIAQSAYQIASGMVREDLADVGPKLPDWMGGASWGQVASDAISTTANMAPSILSSMAMNILVPGSGVYVGWAMMGGSAAGNAYQEALNEGYSKDQAKGYGLLVGASEIVMEKVLGGISAFGGNALGKFLTKNLSNADTALKMIAKRLGGSMISEFSEEYLQEVLTPVFQNMVLGTDNEVKLLSPEALYSGMLGALTAGVMEGPGIVSGEVKIKQTGRQLQNAGISAERLAEIGKTFSADTVAYQLAGKVDANTSAYTMGRLFNEIGATLTEQNISDITNALVKKGMDRKTAEANARAMAAVVEGANFTDAEVAIIEGNDILAEAVRTTIIDSNATWYQRANGYNEALMALAQEKAAPKTSGKNRAAGARSDTGYNGVEGFNLEEYLSASDDQELNQEYDKLESLYQQKAALDKKSLEAFNSDHYEEFERLSAESAGIDEQITSVEGRIQELKAAKAEGAAPETEADAGGKVGTEGHSEADAGGSGAMRISAINNGVATVKLADGSEASVSEADLDPDEGVRIETIASIDGISAEDANFILNTLKVSPGTSAQMDSLGAKEAYKYGFYGFSQDHIAKHGVFANSLNETQRQAIYQAGQNARQKQIERTTPKKGVAKNATTGIYFDAGGGNVTALRAADMDGLTDKQKAGVQAAMVLKKLGIGGSIYFFESYRNSNGQLVYKDSSGNEIKAPNGWYSEKDGSIHIDLNAGNKGQGYVLFTVAHELTHFIEQWSPKKYKVLADFLIENYEKGQSMDKLVRAKQTKLSEMRGEKISYDEAYSEVIADSMEAMLADGNVMEKLVELKAKDHDLFAKMKQFFDNLAAKIRNIYKGLTPDSVEGNAVLEMKDSIEKLQRLFAEALVEASENFSSAMESVVETDAEALEENAVLTDGAVVTDGEGKKYSIKSMKADIAEGQMFEDLKTYCGWTQKQVNALKKKLSDLVEYMTPFRDILDMNETYGRDGRRFSPYKPNSDPLYKISMDFSTLCSKRLLTQYVIENLQLRENRPMSAEEQMAIRDMLNEYRKVEKGLQVACAMCYVEAARLKSPKQITKWMEDPGTQMKNYFADKNPEFANFIKEKQAEFKESRGYARNATKKDMSAKDVRELNKIRPRLRSQYQLSAEEAKIIERAKALPGSTYLTAGNLASLSETDPVIYAAYTAFVRTATRSKSLETDEPYYYGDSRRDNGNGIIVSDSFIEAVNRENGMRFSSWSDWRIQHLLDYITAVIDNSVRGAAMHGYTKFGDEVRVLGKTGMMFNMSGVAGTQTGLNEDGSLSFSPTESIDANEAIQLREEFPETAGLQCIGVGDDHITALLRSDIIDYVIPYHTSGLNAALRRMANIYGWKDYTTTQHAAIDKSIKFENAVDQEHWHEEPVYSEFFVGYDTGMTGIEAMRASAERYKQMCKDRGLKPKFEQFANEENYWKLLIDRKMINQKTGKLIQQKAVIPTFDFGTIKEVVDRYVRNYDSNLEARALNHIVENWDSIPQRIKDLKKQGGTKAKKVKKAADALANQTLAAHPTEDGIKQQARPSEKDPRLLDPRTVTKADVLEMLNNVMAGKYYGNTYIPLRIGTPAVLIHWAEKRRGDIIDNNPIAMSAEKAYQAMARKGQDINGRPHELSPDDIVSIIESMSDPEYIVYQEANGRYVEVVSYDTDDGRKALAILEIGDYKPEWTMNGYEQGMYNILVTTYPPDQGVVSDLLRKKTNRVIYDKKKDAPRGTPGSTVPSVSNDASFYEEIVSQNENEIKKKSDRESLTSDQQKYFDYNQRQATVGSTLKTLKGSSIKRSTKYGVGKEIGGEIYFHKVYADDIIPDEVLSQAEHLLEENHPGFEYNCLKYNPKTGVVAFQEAPDFDSAREPIVGDYVSVNTNTGVVKTGHSNYIWHHKWNWVKNDYSGFDVEASWNWSKEWLSTLTEVSDGNGIDRWNAQLDKFGLSHDGEDVLYSARPVEQKHTSAGTSINATKVPSLYTAAHKKRLFKEGGINIDIGAGRFETATDFLKSIGVTSLPFDPFNRTTDVNKKVVDFLMSGERADTATCSNCLNVIDSAEARANVILEVAKSIKPDGTAIFTVYENKKSFEEGKAGEVARKPDQWQEFRSTASYVPEIQQYFDDVPAPKGGLIIARNPKKNLPKAAWQISSKYSAVEAGVDDAVIMYSDRDNESVSNRYLLANAFESAAQNDIERNRLQEYKGKISLIESEERKLQKLNQQIKDLSFAKGPKDTAKIREIQFEARQTANRINTYDRQLLRLEASKPLQDVLTREKKLAYQRAEKKGKEALEAYREKAMKTQREMMDRYQASRKQSIENRHRTEMRHKIKDVVNELNEYLLKGSKDKRVMVGLQKAVAEALDAVNMDTVGAEERIAKLEAELLKAKTPEQIQEISRKIDRIREMGDRMNNRLKALKDAYREITESDDPLIANAHDEVIEAKLESVIEKVGNTPLRDMTLEQLEEVYDMYRMVLTTIRNSNKAFKAAKSESIAVLANRVMEEVEQVGGKRKYTPVILEAIKKFGWNNLKPVYAFLHIGSDTLTRVFDNVRAGEDVWALDVTEAREFYLDRSGKFGYDSWNFDKRYTFTSSSGMNFSLNLEQIMSLYAYSKRDQAADHLKRGGIVIDETTEITMKTKLGIPVKFNPTEATAYNISEETLAEIIGKLSDEQKGFVDEMQEYLSTVMGAKGNEVSLELYGIKLFKEKFYFPLKSASQFMAKAKEQQQGEVKIKNSGFSKETVKKASNPIVLSTFMNVWSNHVNEMSMYHAFVLPMEDFYRVYNYRTPTSDSMATESVEMFIQNAYGKGATGYIDRLLKDLNGGARTDSTTGIINKMMGLFKKGAVFASLSVVVQQPSAIARAAALVDTKYFIGPKVDHKRHKALWNEVKQYAPVAMIKEMGYFDTNMGKSTQDFILGKEYSGFKEKMKALVTDSGYRDEALSKAPALADELAWCSIWEAVKRETMAKNPGLQVGSEEFLQKVGERFTEVIVKTQVYDSVLSRSANMRSKDTGMKMATAFMAEPTTSINMITDALLQGKRGNRKYARGAIGAVIASQILNSILVSFVYAGRDDDEDETYLEKYIGTLTGEIVDSLNPAGYIPFIKDIQSIVQGYDVERSDMAVISDLWNAWQNLSKDSVSTYRKVEGFVGSICQIFGLPVKNIMRDVRGIYQTIMSFQSGQQTTRAGIGYAVKSAVTGEDVKDQQQLYEAILNGDKTQIARVKSRFKDQSAINSAIRKALRENDPRIAQAAQAKFNGDLDEYMRLARAIIAEKHFSQDDVVAAINAEINALDKGEPTTSAPKASGLFKAADFAAAIAQGDQAMANAIKTDIISTAQKNGKTQEEAEKSFVSSAKSDMKELFMEGKISGEKAIMALMTYCDMEQEDAEQVIGEWEFKAEYGFGYDERIKQFKAGNISASELKSVIMSVEGKDEETANTAIVRYSREAYEEGFFSRNEAASIMTTYGGLTAAEAEADLQYIDVKLQFPDTYVDDAWVEEYYNEVQASGISIEVFVDYRNKVKGITGSGKKEGRMAVIDSMPISNAQKDALYYAEGWAASRIYEAPWH